MAHLLGISGDDSTATVTAAANDDDVGGVSVSLRRRLLSFETTILLRIFRASFSPNIFLVETWICDRC